jgi:hypothetical protein
MTTGRRDEFFTFRLTSAERTALANLAERYDTKQADIVRAAVRALAEIVESAPAVRPLAEASVQIADAGAVEP